MTEMMKKLGSVVLVGLMLLTYSVDLGEGKIVEPQDWTVETPDYSKAYGYYPIIIEVPDDNCEKRVKDVIISRNCPSIYIVTYVRAPAAA